MTAVFATLLATAIGCTMLCYDWAILVDKVLGVNSSDVIIGEIDENSIYYKSSFGDISPLYIAKDKRTAEQQASLTRMQKELVEAEKAFCEREAEEGCVLLKNEDKGEEKALPLAKNSKITLFGYAAGYPVYRSSSGSSSPNVEGRTISPAQAMRDEGFEINETLQSAIESCRSDRRVSSPTNGLSDIGELDVDFYSPYKSSFKEYGDAAVVILSRTAARA